MPSFDITSEFDAQEVDNAVNQAAREIGTRFDFRGGKSEISYDRATKVIKLIATERSEAVMTIGNISDDALSRRDPSSANGKTHGQIRIWFWVLTIRNHWYLMLRNLISLLGMYHNITVELPQMFLVTAHQRCRYP